MTRAAALSVLGLLHTVPVGFSSSPFSSGHRDRWGYLGNGPPSGDPPNPSRPGPTWDGGPHVEAVFSSLELVLVVKQGEVGPGDGAVLGEHVGGQGRCPGHALLICQVGPASRPASLPGLRLPERRPASQPPLGSLLLPTPSFWRNP